MTKKKSARTTARRSKPRTGLKRAPLLKTRVAPRQRPAAKPRADLWSGLVPNAANFAPLSPVTFLPRAAELHPDRVAMIHGSRRISYAEFHARARRLASALAKRGVRKGDTVSVMLPNVPAMLEAHFGVPMLGAVLNAINTRLDADTVAYILDHGEAKAMIVDRPWSVRR
jgi:fatty-acyl-CoA synthase